MLEVKVSNVYRRNQAAKEQIVINKGGAGSSKSYSLCQFYIFERLLKYPGWRGLISRKTRQSLKLSTYKMFFDILESSGVYREKNHNKTDMVYTHYFKNGKKSEICFGGMNNRERIKSREFHDIWLEEGNEFEKEDFTFCKTRLYRGELPKNFPKPQIRVSYNPVMCWIQDIETKPRVKLIHSTYKDNPFCNEEYAATLEGLKDEDPTYYKIYCLGLDGEPEHIIYKPYRMMRLEDYPKRYDDYILGIDFGYNLPSAVVGIGYKDKVRYLSELLYQTKLTNSQLIEKLKEIFKDNNFKQEMLIYADNAEPNRIEEINNAGFNCLPADKSVKDGLDFCKRQQYVSCEENVNLNKERSGYKHKVDKSGKVFDDPVKFKDHAMDSKRYGDYTHNKGNTDSKPIKEVLKDLEEAPELESLKADW